MSAISSAVSVDRSVSGNRFSEMATEDFIKIIFTELTNQDPLQPNDTNALLEQLNSIRSIESDVQLGKQLEALVTENQLASASSAIGRFVGGRDVNLERVAGYVISAQRQGSDILLELDTGNLMPFRNVELILDPALQPTEP